MSTSDGLGRYWRLTRVPGFLPLLGASLIARLPLGMSTLALLLLAQRSTGSYQLAGIAVGCFALASALGSPARGRLADRYGPSPVLLVTGVAQPVALVGVALTAAAAASTPAPMLVTVALAGLLVPPVGPVTRAAWQQLVTAPDLARAAFALDSLVLQIIFYIAGPPIVAVIATAVSPSTAVLAVAALTLVGNLAVTQCAPVRRMPRRREHQSVLGPLTEPRLIAVLLTCIVTSAAFAALEATVASWTISRNATAWSGLLLALIGVGSIAGGLFYGTRSPTAPMARQYRRWLLVLAVGTAPLVLAPNIVVLGVLLVAAGVAIGPASTSQFNLVGELGPAGALTESFTWLFSAVLAGTALGNYLAGTAVEIYGAQLALALPLALVLLAAASALAIRPQDQTR